MGFTTDYGILMGPRPENLNGFMKKCYDNRGVLQFGVLISEGKLSVSRDSKGEIIKFS
jgi:hypothetical protein